MSENILIIGNGITGITAARHIRKMSSNNILVISSESEYFFSRTALMYVYMGHEKFENIKPYEDGFWKKSNIKLVFDHVTHINTVQKQVNLSSGNVLNYDKLIIASGSRPNRFGWKGQDLHGVQGLYSLQDLKLLESNSRNIKKAVIVGGGLIGIELAEMLLSRNIEVTMLVRESGYWNNILPEEESQMISRYIMQHHIDLRLSTEAEEFIGDENGRVKSVITITGDHIECQFIGLTAGVSPNIDLVKNSGINYNRGILVNEYLETNIIDVYAAGDCAEFQNAILFRKNIEQVWYTGRLQAEALAQTICGNRTAYSPGVWFNSAKFLDIEYQVYGLVNKNIPGEKNLYFENDEGNKSIRIVYTDESVIGFNLMGIRYRQEVCEKWIREKYSIETVLENLGEANFDPEFFRQYEYYLIKKFNSLNPGKNILLRKKRKLVNSLFNNSAQS
ncbi:MAG: NAD(P)/FAD-dependent oxidoreductase [Ignavibacteria bacterium]|nr:NAD(P)/FAD-dependent oxidoreductase [Ignavibacteria bacterium]